MRVFGLWEEAGVPEGKAGLMDKEIYVGILDWHILYRYWWQRFCRFTLLNTASASLVPSGSSTNRVTSFAVSFTEFVVVCSLSPIADVYICPMDNADLALLSRGFLADLRMLFFLPHRRSDGGHRPICPLVLWSRWVNQCDVFDGQRANCSGFSVKDKWLVVSSCHSPTISGICLSVSESKALRTSSCHMLSEAAATLVHFYI